MKPRLIIFTILLAFGCGKKGETLSPSNLEISESVYASDKVKAGKQLSYIAFFFVHFVCQNKFKRIYLQPLKGRMAERLGTGLQNPLQRFESASDLIIIKKRL